MIVVIVPAPAIKGNAIGTKVPDLDSGSSLKISIPNIISNPKSNRMIAPATANDCTSTPNKPNNLSPKYKKADMIKRAARLALKDSILIPLFLRSMMIGMFPMISITEKRISVIERIA